MDADDGTDGRAATDARSRDPPRPRNEKPVAVRPDDWPIAGPWRLGAFWGIRGSNGEHLSMKDLS